MTEIIEKKITVKEFRVMDFPENDFFIYELINGVIMRKAAPQPTHQEASIEVEFAIKLYLKQHPIGKMYHAPIDVFFDNHNQSQPDILFIKEERAFIIDKKEGILGAPDLIVEIISPGSVRLDRVTKKALYEHFAVKEYWIVDPNNQTVEIHILKDNKYVEHQFLETEGKIESLILVGLDLDISTLFSQ
jgi:Uma2 family endonuclease